MINLPTKDYSLDEYRPFYKPFSDLKSIEYYQVIEQTYWRPETVNMHKDVLDFSKASETVKQVVGGILKGFTITECLIGAYWNYLAQEMPWHEIIAACTCNAVYEVNHARAYSHLNDTLKLNNYRSFLEDEVVKKKVDLFNIREQFGKRTIKENIGICSGAGEGVSLFSSFAILLAFGKKNKFTGVGQMISWSARDEMNHSNYGAHLFGLQKKFFGLKEEEKDNIYEGFVEAVNNEIAFIKKVFTPVPGVKFDESEIPITPEDLFSFIYYTANERLSHYGLDCIFDHDENYQNVAEWFHAEIKGLVNVDFFITPNDGGAYTASLPQKFGQFDYSIYGGAA